MCLCIITLVQCSIFDPSNYSEVEYSEVDENAGSKRAHHSPFKALTDAEQDKCYAKCLMENMYEEDEIEVFIYNGLDTESPGVEIREFTIVEGDFLGLEKMLTAFLRILKIVLCGAW